MKPDWYLMFLRYRSQLIAGGLMCCVGFGLGVLSPDQGLRDTVQVVFAPTATPSDGSRQVQRAATPSAASRTEASPSEARLSPAELNLIKYYDGDGPGAITLAEKLYDELAAREAQWISEIYGLYNNVETDSLLSFNGIQLQFVDGDGNGAAESSNIKDIMAMTNVYYSYGKLPDWEAIRSYAVSLWEASHQYAYELGPIYYCEGCIPVEQKATPSDSSDSSVNTATPWGALKRTEDGSFILEGEEGGPGISDAQLKEMELEMEESQTDAEPQEPEAALTCAGHADLLIKIQVSGPADQNSLYVLDSIGGTPDADSAEGGWPGWTAETMGYAAELMEQDWAEQYGLGVEGMVVRGPLTSAELDHYMAMVPAGASEERREIVWWALSSVGKIPYYWGGKPSRGGYEGNHFGTVTAADEDGRFLKGLDCSGWISWVYLSATGRRLSGESTSTMISCGTAITKEELQPGDICIRLGEMPHAVLFLGWTDTGEMLCIQETSGNINNVEVGIVKSDWPYYRRLVE